MGLHVIKMKHLVKTISFSLFLMTILTSTSVQACVDNLPSALCNLVVEKELCSSTDYPINFGWECEKTCGFCVCEDSAVIPGFCAMVLENEYCDQLGGFLI